jgi:hypothetical protein
MSIQKLLLAVLVFPEILNIVEYVQFRILLYKQMYLLYRANTITGILYEQDIC